MTPATNPTPPTARSQTREGEIVQLLTERRGEKLTLGDIARALLTGPENVRGAVARLHGRGEIQRVAENHKYAVGNSVATRLLYRWYVPVWTEAQIRQHEQDAEMIGTKMKSLPVAP